MHIYTKRYKLIQSNTGLLCRLHVPLRLAVLDVGCSSRLDEFPGVSADAFSESGLSGAAKRRHGDDRMIYIHRRVDLAPLGVGPQGVPDYGVFGLSTLMANPPMSRLQVSMERFGQRWEILPFGPNLRVPTECDLLRRYHALSID